jgi:hypothetical protein
MRGRQIALLASTSIVVLGVLAWAQAVRKPGLWEITSVMTWQQSPLPPNVQMPAGANSPFGGGSHTIQYCLTQAMIDRFGAPMPQSHGNCNIINVSKTADGMTAQMVCTGLFSGKGDVESHWSDDGTAKGKMHFVGSMQMGQNSRPIEWTSESTSVYKGPDCGSVQPPPMPASN